MIAERPLEVEGKNIWRKKRLLGTLLEIKIESKLKYGIFNVVPHELAS